MTSSVNWTFVLRRYAPEYNEVNLENYTFEKLGFPWGNMIEFRFRNSNLPTFHYEHEIIRGITILRIPMQNADFNLVRYAQVNTIYDPDIINLLIPKVIKLWGKKEPTFIANDKMSLMYMSNFWWIVYPKNHPDTSIKTLGEFTEYDTSNYVVICKESQYSMIISCDQTESTSKKEEDVSYNWELLYEISSQLTEFLYRFPVKDLSILNPDKVVLYTSKPVESTQFTTLNGWKAILNDRFGMSFTLVRS